MKYNLIVNQENKTMDVSVSGQDITAAIGGAVYDVSFMTISDHQILLNVNGKHFNAYVLNDRDRKTIIINGRPYQVQDSEMIGQSIHRKKSFTNTSSAVLSPMPAVVTNILVELNDNVEKGQGLIIVSAMKMETTLCAPFSGRVSRINAQIGDKVMPADILVDIEKS